MRHFSFFQLVHARFSLKLGTFGGDMLGEVGTVGVHFSAEEEGGEEESDA